MDHSSRDGSKGETDARGDKVEVVGKTDTGEDALALVQEMKPDILIMQVDEALHKAKNTLERIREALSPPKVTILTMFEEPRMVREIMELGASPYIHKSASVEDLFTALRTTTLDSPSEHVVIAMP